MVGIPYRDTTRVRVVPYVNLAIIVINLVVFLYEVALSQQTIIGSLTELDRFIFEWGSIPACTLDAIGIDTQLSIGESTRCNAQPNIALTPVTSMFIHGGWLHLAANMLFLWIFGDNVEDAMGHLRYGLFYLVCGIAATFAHASSDIESIAPAIGASGAISGVMGAYLVLYPRGPIYAFPFFFIPFPAWLFIGVYMVLQFNAGIASLGPDAVGAGDGVAYFAHIGGFVVGAALVLPFMAGRPRRRLRRARIEEAW
jgi:membrane associated rhomboid family serine protease